jgi:hypothetical protein
MADLDHMPAVTALIERLRAARSGTTLAATTNRPAAVRDVNAEFARIEARWASEYRAFEVEYWAEHPPEPTLDTDDAPEPNIVKRKRRPLIFRERDIKRAIAGHMKAGLSVKRTEIDASGRIVIVTGQPEQTSITPENEWDTVQ